MSDTTSTQETTDGTTEEAPETADQIRADIEETRASMTETIDAIQEKLSPEHIKEQVKEKLHDATVGRAQTLAHTAGEKLAPVAEKAEELSENFEAWSKDTGRTVRSTAKETQQWVRKNPLIAGGAALGALVLVGVSLFVNRRTRY